MAIVILLSLLILSLGQVCPPYCQTCNLVSTSTNCTSCQTGGTYMAPLTNNGVIVTVNGGTIMSCKLCYNANQGCLACTYAPSLTYGISCSSCQTGYGIPYGVGGCVACPTGCLTCNAYTTGMGSACGANVPSASCGTNGLVCSQCATNYTIGSVDLNCYYCPTVSANCLVNSCTQLALGVFSCNTCASNAYIFPINSNGTNYNSCLLCSSANSGCTSCGYNTSWSSPFQCYSCSLGYNIPSGSFGCISCPSNCQSCTASTTGMGSACGASIPSSSCGTNGLICSQCNTTYTLGSVDLNCYYCPTVVTNCLVNSCSEVSLGMFSCSSCANGSFNTPVTSNGNNVTVNGNLVWTCNLCSAANAPCTACSYAPTLSYGIQCTACIEGAYGIPYGVWACLACPNNCLSCSATTTGMGNACGAGVTSANCGTNGLVCNQCASGYTLGAVDLNCYYCPTVVPNCAVNSCSQVALGVFSCNSCANNSYILPLTNGTNYTECQLCSTANAECLTCTFAPSLTYGIQCTSCVAGYGIPYGVGGCVACPSNCLNCTAYTTGMGSACGANVPTSSCGTNGLVCSQCAANYTLGTIDLNCYYCPTVVANCLVNSCSQLSLGVFSCNTCANSYFTSPMTGNTSVNGNSVWVCELCSTANKGCTACEYAPSLTYGIYCTSCQFGYGIPYGLWGCVACPTGCNVCNAYTTGMGSACGANVPSSSCGTNGLVCSQCNGNYTLGAVDLNCYFCPNVSANCIADACSQVALGVFSCSACMYNSYSIPISSNGTNYTGCELCSTANTGCLACTYAPTLNYGIQCSSCLTGYGIPYELWGCQLCPTGCLTCQASTTGMGNECGAGVTYTDCGTNGLVCSQCDTGFFLGEVDLNCYYCPNISANCAQCAEVALGEFICNECIQGAVLIGQICQTCSDVYPNCMNCTSDYGLASGMLCLQCTQGYAVSYESGANYGSCQPCGTNCQACQANTGNECGSNITSSECGTNGLICSQCATGYYINSDANCYDCPTLSANCNQNSCMYVAPGVYTCNSCANNSYSTPMTFNGQNYTVNGSLVWVCQICSAGGSNCLTCTYDPQLPSNMFCQSCDAGFAVSFGYGQNYGTCQPCQSYCISCQYNQGLSSGCGANIPFANCGTNGMMCNQCAANYTLGIDANCYFCPTVSTYCLVNSCAEVDLGVFNCSACISGAYSLPMSSNGTYYTVNGNFVSDCQLCSTANIGCLTCQYAPNMTYGIYCSSCSAGYGIPYGIWGCEICPDNCLACNAYTTGMGSACGANVPSASCGTNGLVCSQCTDNYTLGTVDLNCYYCPTVSPNCLVNACSQMALGVFSCSACASDAFILPMAMNGINYTICQLCSAVDSYCTNCTFDPTLSSGMQCLGCMFGYAVSYEQGINFGTCQPCGSNCQECYYNQGSSSGCGANIAFSSCGTNGLMCTQCSTNYTLGIDANCYYCPTVSPNCNVNSCNQVSLGVFSCNECFNSSFFLQSQQVNGTSIESCVLCSSVDPNCVLCLANPSQSTGMACVSCLIGYTPNYWASTVSICQLCGSNCLSCKPQQQTNGCNFNGTCGTNGLLCNQCVEGYVLYLDANCYSCPTLSPNCDANSCLFASTGVITCTQCTTYAFLVPVTVNGTTQVADGSPAYSCQLCLTQDPNCLTCTYNAGQSTNMVCTSCNPSYALNYWAPVPSTCQTCGINCLTCVFVPTGIVNCTSCPSNSFALPLMVNATNLFVNSNPVLTCQSCSAASSNCLTCTYAPQMSSNMFCSSCTFGFAVVIGANYPNEGTCQSCSSNCLSCQSITGNGCGANIPLANCGTNGVMCNSCETGYTLAPNGNCYNCPILSPGCSPSSCSEVSSGVFTCDQCVNSAALTPVMINGTEDVVNGNTVYSCFVCSTADSNCITCIYDPNQSTGIICTSCVSGYTPNYWASPIGICQPCGSNCLACKPYQQTNGGCGVNVSSSNCGTNGLLCTKCVASYILSSDANCDSCSQVSPNCDSNSCSQVTQGLYNCSLCANNAFSVPMMVNGTAEVVNGANVYSCQLCSIEDSSCLTCTYYSGQSTNMMCTSCIAGYIPNYYATPIGICQQCGSNCVNCQPYQQTAGCASNIAQADCGTNGLMCILCAAGYTLQSDANCYLSSSVELENDLGSNQTNWLFIGLFIFIGLIAVVAIVMVISCIRNRAAKGEIKQKFLSSQIEIGNLNQ